ncbi:MAG: 2-hydroxyacid dehydrogenase [Pseudomonadota bacterium]|nr:2-hydroxyacid dehydrogenase [Pseudomonadota bacterium]
MKRRKQMENPPFDRLAMILVLTPLHPDVMSGLAGRFDVVEADVSTARSLPPAVLSQVRGVACAGTIPRSLVDALPGLEIIASFGVGYDGIDVAHAARCGVVVTNTPNVLNEDVADTAVWLLLEAARGFSKAQDWLREGRWESEGPYPLSPLSLSGRSVGIWGLGRIGLAIARRVEAFGLPISYHSRRPVAGVPYHYQPSLQALAEAVDTLVAVVPGGSATDRAIDGNVLAALGREGIFINVGRGSTVDEDALIRCLRDGTIAAAGLDVFASEPRVREEFLALDNVAVLPHVAAATARARGAVARLVVDNLVEWFAHARALTPVSEVAAQCAEK